jgi:LTXXQ motif family protein
MTPRTFSALALAAMLAGGGALALSPTTSSAQAQQQAEHAAFNPRHIEGRIAHIKTELKITDAQAPLFDAVANVMRDNAKAMGDAAQSLRGDPNQPRQPRTALTRLEAHAKFGELRAQGDAKLLAAFRPLYQSLTPDQQKSADEAFEGHHDHGHF